MCGGHGLHHLIGMAAAGVVTTEGTERITSQTGASQPDVENEVELMYARGEIGERAFHHLIAMARAGELRIQDIRAFETHPTPNIGRSARPQPGDDESGAAYRHELQNQRRYLEAACAETEESLRRLQLEVAALYQAAESAADAGAKADALARAESLEQRIDLIRDRLSQFRASFADVVARQRLMQSY